MATAVVEGVFLLALVFLHLYISPFTKVEESFNLQASYDLLYKPWTSVGSFDHIEFPGVVPRTFIGPLVLVAMSIVPKTVFGLDAFAVLHIVRMSLGLLTVLSLLAIRNALATRFSPRAGAFFIAITASQFHLLFYASRTLPNTFALCLTNIAFADRIKPYARRYSYRSIAIMSVTCALFRSELCLYILTTLLTELALQRIELMKTIVLGLSAAVTTAVASISIDSYFWQRLCYPELEVFYFNVVLNKSSAWGELPFHWYFTNALPRALGGSLFLALLGTCLHAKEVAPLIVPALLFVCTYSVLPHKELRFIFYVLPVFNAVAAVCASDASRSQVLRYSAKKYDDIRGARLVTKSALSQSLSPSTLRHMLILLLFSATLLLSIAQTGIATFASRANYASGAAMRAMQAREGRVYREESLCGRDGVVARVHIDAHSAMNGISQFLEARGTGCPWWEYSKREDVEQVRWADFTHLISGRAAVQGFCVVGEHDGYAGLDWRALKVRMAPHTFVHRNVNVSRVGCLRR